MLVTTNSMANEPKMSLATGEDSKSIVLEMDSQAKESKIKITDGNDLIIYFENIGNAKFTKKFNFKNLAVGNYYFIIENTLSSTTYTLSVDNYDVKIKSKLVNTTKPIFRTVDDKVYVNLFNTDQQKVDIEIVNSQGSIVFKESTKGELTIGKAFNFKKAQKGRYTIIIKDGEKIYYKNIVID